MSIFKVQEFHRKFGLHDGAGVARLLTEEEMDFRVRFMQEELNEFNAASERGDLVKAFDALLDLSYVVYGTALMMGISPVKWVGGFETVHDRNMLKERAKPDGSDSKRGSRLDVVKPPGWTGPEDSLRVILSWKD